MTWIRTVPLAEADEKLRRALEAQQELYPAEYAVPVHPEADPVAGIVASHSAFCFIAKLALLAPRPKREIAGHGQVACGIPRRHPVVVPGVRGQAAQHP